MKNEGPYILEWVAHHLAIGFDGILVFTNDCDDLTDRILERLERIVPVFHRPNPKALFADRGNWQVMAQRYAMHFPVYRDAGWIYHTDVDEFLRIRVGAGRLDDLAAAAGDFDVISFTSMPFNSDGRKRLEDRFVTQQFLHLNKAYAAPAGPVVENAIKTLFCNDIAFDMRRNHRPLRADFSASGRVWIDGSGQRLGPGFVDGRQKHMDALVSTGLAQVNHYAIRSAESFLIKLDRGDVAGASRLGRGRSYWEGYDTPGDADAGLATPSAAMLAAHAALTADPLLAEMHAASFARHQAKVLRLLEGPLGQAAAGWLGLTPV